MSKKPKEISVRFSEDLQKAIDEKVDQSMLFENRSHLIRAAVRTFLDSGDEFDRAE